MSGVGAVKGDGMAGRYDSQLGGGMYLGHCGADQQPLSGQKGGATLQEILRTARGYLRTAGIRIPHATLEVTARNEAILHGVPEGGQILVCALNEDGIQNYL